MQITSSFLTGDYHGYNVKYSPVRPDLLACATCENYGIAGKIVTILIIACVCLHCLEYNLKQISGFFVTI